MKHTKFLPAFFALMATQASAGIPVRVPEVGATGSIIALATIAAAGALAWERSRKNRD